MKKILIIDPGKGWGHFVSKIYAFRALSEHLEKKLIIITKESTQAKSYLKNENFCQDIIYLDDSKGGIKKIFDNFKQNLRLIKIIKNLNVDSCYIFHPSLRLVLLAHLSQINKVFAIGHKYQNFFIKEDRRLYKSFFSKTVLYDMEASNYVEKLCNIKKIKFKPLNNPSKEKKTLIGIGIAASEIEKRWPIDNYIKIIQYLSKNNKTFLIVSGKDQEKEEDLIKTKLLNYNLDLIFTSNKKIASVIPDLLKCKFYIGNDTGFSHLSVNYGIISHIIYGNCIPQYYSEFINVIDKDEDIKRSNESIKSISVDKVIRNLF